MTSINQLKPTAMLQNIPDQHMQFVVYFYLFFYIVVVVFFTGTVLALLWIWRTQAIFT